MFWTTHAWLSFCKIIRRWGIFTIFTIFWGREIKRSFPCWIIWRYLGCAMCIQVDRVCPRSPRLGEPNIFKGYNDKSGLICSMSGSERKLSLHHSIWDGFIAEEVIKLWYRLDDLLETLSTLASDHLQRSVLQSKHQQQDLKKISLSSFNIFPLELQLCCVISLLNHLSKVF